MTLSLPERGIETACAWMRLVTDLEKFALEGEFGMPAR
jgi:hypothetical protein